MQADLKFVPTFEKLEDIYHDNIENFQLPRYTDLRNNFKAKFNADPQFVTRAPGRVCILGDHMDCQDYSVIPAAIDHDFLMAYRAIEEGEEGCDQITITNKDETFSTLTLSTNPEQGLFERTGSDAEDWINYFICGYKAILSCNEDLKKMVLRPKGLKIYIDSRVPIAVGLSSSAAITVCAAITTLHANGLQRQVPQDLLSELSITAERMAGTACGGMDQTASIMGQKDCALLIDFKPKIAAIQVKIPDQVCFVITNTCVQVKKVLTLGTRFNCRVCEVRFAVAAMAVKSGACEKFDECPYQTMESLSTYLSYDYEQMFELAQESLKQEPYTIKELQDEFQVEDPFKIVTDISHYQEVKKQIESFPLFKRAYHVCKEAKRVHDFNAACIDTTTTDDQKVEILGNHMNESQYNFNNYYNNSCAELEELTQLARDSGAIGSKQSGAGWGGVCVSMVPKDKINEFLTKIRSYYEKERPEDQKLLIPHNIDSNIFVTQPAQGACVFDPQDYFKN